MATLALTAADGLAARKLEAVVRQTPAGTGEICPKDDTAGQASIATRNSPFPRRAKRISIHNPPQLVL